MPTTLRIATDVPTQPRGMSPKKSLFGAHTSDLSIQSSPRPGKASGKTLEPARTTTPSTCATVVDAGDKPFAFEDLETARMSLDSSISGLARANSPRSTSPSRSDQLVVKYFQDLAAHLPPKPARKKSKKLLKNRTQALIPLAPVKRELVNELCEGYTNARIHDVVKPDHSDLLDDFLDVVERSISRGGGLKKFMSGASTCASDTLVATPTTPARRSQNRQANSKHLQIRRVFYSFADRMEEVDASMQPSGVAIYADKISIQSFAMRVVELGMEWSKYSLDQAIGLGELLDADLDGFVSVDDFEASVLKLLDEREEEEAERYDAEDGYGEDNDGYEGRLTVSALAARIQSEHELLEARNDESVQWLRELAEALQARGTSVRLMIMRASEGHGTRCKASKLVAELRAAGVEVVEPVVPEPPVIPEIHPDDEEDEWDVDDLDVRDIMRETRRLKEEMRRRDIELEAQTEILERETAGLGEFRGIGGPSQSVARGNAQRKALTPGATPFPVDARVTAGLLTPAPGAQVQPPPPGPDDKPPKSAIEKMLLLGDSSSVQMYRKIADRVTAYAGERSFNSLGISPLNAPEMVSDESRLLNGQVLGSLNGSGSKGRGGDSLRKMRPGAAYGVHRSQVQALLAAQGRPMDDDCFDPYEPISQVLGESTMASPAAVAAPKGQGLLDPRSSTNTSLLALSRSTSSSVVRNMALTGVRRANSEPGMNSTPSPSRPIFRSPAARQQRLKNVFNYETQKWERGDASPDNKTRPGKIHTEAFDKPYEAPEERTRFIFDRFLVYNHDVKLAKEMVRYFD
uniref:EF-hand domain-containing protein n=1 Tax=Phaeomonas parva TaxID=124430 RepID=A0A6U4C351_9STRA|mmetsp:Transcript_10911/g.33185  ORF Transcript_10911/g.33185 Transcript_10911/m.33185 type:complete len:804 (+) Transcript_10911:348-2759(+)